MIINRVDFLSRKLTVTLQQKNIDLLFSPQPIDYIMTTS